MTELETSQLLARGLAALDDLKSKDPSAASRLAESLAAHMRSGYSQSLLSEPRGKVTRQLMCGGVYQLAREGDAVRLYIREGSEHDVAVKLVALECVRLRSDISSVAGGGE